MTEIITYRLSSAGAWGYEFYDAGRNRIGSVSTDVMPSSPALIKGEGIDWYSTFSMEHTIVPGTGRWVKNNQNGLHLWTYCSHSCAFVTGYVVRPAVFPASLKGKGPVPPGAGPRFISAGNPWPLSRIR